MTDTFISGFGAGMLFTVVFGAVCWVLTLFADDSLAEYIDRALDPDAEAREKSFDEWTDEALHNVRRAETVLVPVVPFGNPATRPNRPRLASVSKQREADQ